MWSSFVNKSRIGRNAVSPSMNTLSPSRDLPHDLMNSPCLERYLITKIKLSLYSTVFLRSTRPLLIRSMDVKLLRRYLRSTKSFLIKKQNFRASLFQQHQHLLQPTWSITWNLKIKTIATTKIITHVVEVIGETKPGSNNKWSPHHNSRTAHEVIKGSVKSAASSVIVHAGVLNSTVVPLTPIKSPRRTISPGNF